MASVYDLIVRLAGDGKSLRDDIEKDKAKIDELFAKIDEKHSIDLSTATAEERIDLLEQKLEAVKDAHAKLEIDDIQAAMAIEKIKAELEALKDDKVTISIEDEEAKLKLDGLKSRLDLFHDKTISLKVNDAEANAKLDALGAKIAALSTESKAAGAAAGEKGAFSWGSLILSLLPAVSPLSADLAGGAGGLASALAPGLAGGLGFGAVGMTTLTPVFSDLSKYDQAKATAQATLNNPAATNAQKLAALQQEQAALNGLDQEQLKAFHDTQQFASEWKSFSEQFQKPVLTAYTNTLKLIMQLMNSLAPAIKGFGNGLIQLQQDASRALGAPFWKSFFSYLGANAKASIVSFGEAAGNLAKGLAGLLMAFQPLAKSMETGLVNMTKGFANWATHLSATKGFQQFLDYVKQTGPQVLSLIGSLAQIIVSLLKAMAPMGAVILTMVTDTAKWLSEILKANPLLTTLIALVIEGIGVFKLLKFGIGAITSGFEAVTKIVTSTISVVTKIPELFGMVTKAFSAVGAAIDLIGGPWTLLIAAIVAGVILIVTHWKQISTEAVKIWTAIVKWLETVGKEITAGFTKTWDHIVKWLAGVWKSITEAMTTAWTDIVGFFRKYGLDILAALTGPVGALVIYLATHWKQVVSDAKNIWGEFVSWITNLGNEAYQWGANIINHIAAGISSAIGAVRSAVSNVASAIGNFLGFHSPTEEGPGAEADQWMPNLMNMLTSGVKAGTPQLQAALNAAMALPVSGGVASMFFGGNHTLQVVHTGGATVTHQGNVTVGGLTPKAIEQVNQHLYIQTRRRM